MPDILFLIGLLLASVFIAFSVGVAVGHHVNERYVKMKGDSEGKTAMYIDGAFYYVVPAKEYNELTLARHQAELKVHLQEYNEDNKEPNENDKYGEDSNTDEWL